MKSLRNHFSVIFPLVVILLSLQFSISLAKLVKDYEMRLTDDYSIIIVSVKKLNEKSVKSDISDFKSLTQMSTKKVLDKLKNDISSKNILLLQEALPKFYSLKLTSFPSNKRLQQIKRKLQNYTTVTRVEVFSKTHDKIYKLFVIAKSTSYIFTALMFLVSLLLVLKQMRIWVYEHKERMDIMTLFGAPFWMKSAVLYRLAVIDSIISTCIVVAIFYFLPNVSEIKKQFDDLDILLPQISIFFEGGLLLLIAFIFSLFAVSLVMLKIKRG